MGRTQVHLPRCSIATGRTKVVRRVGALAMGAVTGRVTGQGS